MSRRKRYTRNLGRTSGDAIPKRGTGSRYVRFAHARDPYGIFSYVSDARTRLSEPDREALDALVAWFRQSLDIPLCLIPAYLPRRRGRDNLDGSAVCWFRASAREHVEHARALAILVLRAKIPIVERWSDRIPGRICSTDAKQIAVASFWA